jgi:hypothetical protein
MYAWQWATIATLYREAGGGEPPFVLVEHVFCLPSGLSERSSARPEAVVTSVTARPERFHAPGQNRCHHQGAQHLDEHSQ